MTQDHPITPPPGLVKQWVTEVWHEGTPARLSLSDMHIATEAALWAADQELEACVNYVDNTISGNKARALRAARRPKQPSLKTRLREAIQREELDTALRLVEGLNDSL